MTTVAKFLDMSVCGGSSCLDPNLSPFLVKFNQILESLLLDNPHKAAVLLVGCAIKVILVLRIIVESLLEDLMFSEKSNKPHFHQDHS